MTVADLQTIGQSAGIEASMQPELMNRSLRRVIETRGMLSKEDASAFGPQMLWRQQWSCRRVFGV
jgi:hypothetical protein